MKITKRTSTGPALASIRESIRCKVVLLGLELYDAKLSARCKAWNDTPAA